MTIKSAGLRFLIGVTLTISAVVLVNVTFRAFEESYRLKFIPYGMPVSKVFYAEEESWGFGPGGNETGVIVFDLPDAVALEIQKSGIAYFTNLPKKLRQSGEWRGIYEHWSVTPIPFSKNWGGPSIEQNISSTGFVPMLSDYLDRYGFGIPIDAIVQKQINDSIQRPGSYFAYGRVGILIVSPRERRAFYVYNG